MALSGEITKRYLSQFPDTPSLTLGRILFAENKEVFSSIDTCRASIRYYRGKLGGKNRSRMKEKDRIEKNPRPLNPFGIIPEGITELGDWKPVSLKKDNILVLHDVHVPFHDKAALEIALEYGYTNGVQSILMNGDMSDFHAVSSFDRDPRHRDLAEELEIVKDVLKVIRKNFPKAEMVYKIGNHEERIEKYIRVRCPELFGYNYLSYEHLLGADELDMTIVKDKRLIKAGDLFILHGHELSKGGNPVNAARSAFLKGISNCLIGHFHAISKHTGRNLGGKTIACWSGGMLCDKHPRYAPLNQWSSGFTHVKTYGKDFEVMNKEIIKGKVFAA